MRAASNREDFAPVERAQDHGWNQTDINRLGAEVPGKQLLQEVHKGTGPEPAHLLLRLQARRRKENDSVVAGRAPLEQRLVVPPSSQALHRVDRLCAQPSLKKATLNAAGPNHAPPRLARIRAGSWTLGFSVAAAIANCLRRHAP